ncbi:MAG: hypothetical protein NC924_07575 [Candidatus Omnitrophica bacterium]|nr:hypothetical protein [Candidatus Omnitrophota bacterium]
MSARVRVRRAAGIAGAVLVAAAVLFPWLSAEHRRRQAEHLENSVIVLQARVRQQQEKIDRKRAELAEFRAKAAGIDFAEQEAAKAELLVILEGIQAQTRAALAQREQQLREIRRRVAAHGEKP